MIATETIKLDIACGAQKCAGYLGIDVAKSLGVDIVHDLFRFPWPIESSSVAEARSSHFVEHLPHRECPEMYKSGEIYAPRRWRTSVKRWGFVRDLWYDFWEEVHRVLVPDGTISVVTPYYSSHRADQDPTHERRICEESYFYLSQAWLEQNRCTYPFEANFELVSGSLLHFEQRPNGDHTREINVIDDIAVVLKAKKPSKCWWEA